MRDEELAEVKLSEEVTKKQIYNIVMEVDSAVEWQENSTGNKFSMGDQDTFPFN
jgi:hypothetical protein